MEEGGSRALGRGGRGGFFSHVRVQASVVYEELAKKLEKSLVKSANGGASVCIEQSTQETHSGPEVQTHKHTNTHTHTNTQTHTDTHSTYSYRR